MSIDCLPFEVPTHYPQHSFFILAEDGSWGFCPFCKWDTWVSPMYAWVLGCFGHIQLFVAPWTAATRPPCPSPTSGAYSNSCPSSWWCHPTISSSVVPFSSCLLPSIRVFSSESVLRIRWPEYWSFSFNISPSNEYSGLISFRMDWFDLPAVLDL